jgi:hypothetical protein
MNSAVVRFQYLAKVVPPIGSEATRSRNFRGIKKVLASLDNACESQFVKDPAALKPSRNPLKKR